jgi:hypothetical protein
LDGHCVAKIVFSGVPQPAAMTDRENSVERVAYLRRFRPTMGRLNAADSLTGSLDLIREKLALISDARVRAEAEQLFALLVKSTQPVDQSRDHIFPGARKSLSDLIDYLEANDR